MATVPVPTFNALIHSEIELDMLQDINRDPGSYSTGLLYPTHGEVTLVEVPARLGVHNVYSPYDLDPTLWIGLGNGPGASSFDADACSMTVHRWPADKPQALRRSYTIFCADQGTSRYGGANNEQPYNECINGLTAPDARLWRGNVVVLRSGLHEGRRTKYTMGVSDMTERDIYLVNAILQGVIHEDLLVYEQILAGLPWPAFVALANTNRVLRSIAKRIFCRRLSRRLAHVLLGPATTIIQRQQTTAAFLQLLEDTDAVLTGSIPLAMFTFTEETDHEQLINNINILVPVAFSNKWFQFIIAGLQFNWALENPVRAAVRPHMATFATFARQVGRYYDPPQGTDAGLQGMVVTVTGTQSRSVLPTIFASRFTSQMNFLTSQSIYTFYPKLTMEHRALPAWCTGSLPDPYYAEALGQSAGMFVLLLPDSEELGRPCGAECPRLLRLVAGLTGVGNFNFGPKPETERFGQSNMQLELPFDVESEIISHMPFNSFLAWAAVSRQRRATAWTIFRHRVHCLLEILGIPHECRSDFWSALGNANGGLTGSAVLWLTKGNPDWCPTDCNILVGVDGLLKMQAFFTRLGHHLVSRASRIPRIVPYTNAPTLLPYNISSHWASTTMIAHSRSGFTFTVTEINDPTPLRLLMEAEHSLQTGLLTPTTLIFLYPRDLFARRAILRSGGVTRRSLIDHSLNPATLHARKYVLHPIFQPSYTGLCEQQCCPGVPHRLRGGRGVLVHNWETADVTDFVGKRARTGFMEGEFALVWSWGLCMNYLCPYFLHPRDLLVRGQAPPIPENLSPKEQMIHQKMVAVEHAHPPFAKSFPALLVPTCAAKAAVVAVPLDLHAQTFKTIDDLRLSTWITARPPGSPRIALFLGPEVAGGTVSFASISARRIFYRDDYFIVVFLQCWDDSLRRNLLLYPARATHGPPIHGDVLVVCFHRDEIISPHEIGVDTCRELIRRWWSHGPVFDRMHDFPSARTPA
uniref:F-box domain-containing protein n=1 Tax=Mycena chlorophos TaxID=658473 RepID=A0ABQ0LHB3_MYCCL|nr:predicted protein [Mycena chlorophos]